VLSLQNPHNLRSLGTTLEIYGTTPQKTFKRKLFSVAVLAADADMADGFCAALAAALSEGHPTPRLPVLFMVNPFGGTKKGLRIWEKTVKCVRASEPFNY
jgi:hypothetical protein